jgi:hypothetical protein
MTKKKSGRLSLHPLPVEKAVSALLSTPPPRKKGKPKKNVKSLVAK